MATIIDALAVTLGRHSKSLAQQAEAVWKSFARTAYESNRAARSMEASVKEAAALLVKIRGDALALLDVVAADGDLQGFARNALSGIEQMGQIRALPLSIRRMEADLPPAASRSTATEGGDTDSDVLVPAWSRSLVDSRQKAGVQVAGAAKDVGLGNALSGLHAADQAARVEGGWRSALLALGSLKILSSTESFSDLASVLAETAESIDDLGGDGDAAVLAALPVAGPVAAGIALRARRKDGNRAESTGSARGESSGRVAHFPPQEILDPGSPGDEDSVGGAGAWNPSRLAEFERAFGIDPRQSTPEQQLAFVDWESHGRRPVVDDRQAGARMPMLIELAMNRYLGIAQSVDADVMARQSAAAAGVLYAEAPRDDLARGATAAASIAMAAQGSAVSALTGAAPANGTSETHIHGAITLVTQALDGPGVARELAGMGRSQSLIQQGNTGIF